MSVIETTAAVHAALNERFKLDAPCCRIKKLGRFVPNEADIFLAHQVNLLAQAIHELDVRIERVLEA